MRKDNSNSLAVRRVISVGIVGSGYMAREYCKVIQLHPDYELVGIISRNLSNSKKLGQDFNLQYFPQSISELCKDAKPDLIVVAVSESSTAKVVEELFLHSQVLLVEKPLGLSINESRRLNLGARRRASPTYVAMNRRFYDSTLNLVAELEVEQGNRVVLLQDQHDTIAASRNGFDKLTVQNWMFANAIHTVDLMRFLGRGKIKVEKVSRTQTGESSFVLEASLSFKSGDKAEYISVWNSPGPWVLNVYTEKARLVMGPLEYLGRQVGESRVVEELVSSDSAGALKPGLWNLMDEIRMYWTGGHPRIPSTEDSHESMKLISRIFRTRG